MANFSLGSMKAAWKPFFTNHFYPRKNKLIAEIQMGKYQKIKVEAISKHYEITQTIG